MFTVRVYATPMSLPFSFTIHTWVEISYDTENERYDLWGYPGLHKTPARGYLYKNIFPNHLGTTLSPFAAVNNLAKRQTGKVVSEIYGEAGSLAHTLYIAIKLNALKYPYALTYNMILGPNCNSYTQWLLDLEPTTELILPKNAWGKNYKCRKT